MGTLQSTLPRNAHWEAFEVSAIIVDHELFLNPFEPAFSMLIKLLAFPLSIRELVRSGEGFGLEVSAVELLFSAASALSDDIGMEDVRFAGDISEELKIYFIMGTSFISISTRPKRKSFLDRKADPEVVSSDKERSWPPLEILVPLPPQVMSKSW
nr:hypothetical protein Ahy_B01g055097 isoform E [Ipomoea batatas]